MPSLPPLLTEQNIYSTPSAAEHESSSPLTHGDSGISSLEDGSDRTLDEIRRDETELRSEICHLRTDVARLSSKLKKTMIFTGIYVVLAVVLAFTGFSAALLSRMNGAYEPGNPTDKFVAALSDEIKELRATMKNLDNRPDRQSVKPAEVAKLPAQMDCANLPADIKANAVGFPIHFELKSDKISPESAATLDSIAKILALAPDRCVVIEGHADATGTAEKNMALSKARANSVANYIAGKAGIQRNRLVPLGKGSSSPATGLDPTDPQNRQVIFKVATGQM